MFEPDDKKPTLRRRSLLDLAPADDAARPRSGVVPSAHRSLLDSLADADAAPAQVRRTPRLSLEPLPERREPAGATVLPVDRPTLRSRASGWLVGLAGSRNAAEPPFFNPEPLNEPDGDILNTRTSAPSVYEAPDGDRPLLDLALVIGSVWRLRWLILVLTVLGALGGALVAKSVPNRYISESRLYADPRDIRLTDSDLSNQQLSTEAILAIIDSQMQVLTSPKVLTKVVQDLGLENDPEFGGGAALGGLGLLRELVFGSPPQTPENDRTLAALDTLQDAVRVSRDEKTFIVAVSVTTHGAEKSARIANSVVTTFLNEESNAQSGFFERTTAALDTRIAELSKELDTAETAVERYKADNDIIDASGKLIADNQLISLNDQVSSASNRVAVARAKADTTAGVQPSDILSGAFPEDIVSPTLSELRKQYATANAEFGSLSTRLGPRHPQRVAAEQALEAVRGEIRNELRRISVAARIEFERANETLADLTRQLAVQKTRQVNSSVDLVKLRELERNALATRTIYESFLKRARETSEEQKISPRNIRVISQAEPAARPSGPSRKLIAIGGLLAGLVVGVGLGVLLGAYRSLTSALGWSNRTHDMSPDGGPFDTPPGGGRRDVSGEVPPHWNRYPDETESRWNSPLQPASASLAADLQESRQNVSPDAALQSARTDVVPQMQTADEGPLDRHHQPAPAAEALQAAEAARYALGQRLQRGTGGDDGLRRVHEDLRSLRTKVELYARKTGGTRG